MYFLAGLVPATPTRYISRFQRLADLHFATRPVGPGYYTLRLRRFEEASK
jgi:hypothetical protein